MSSIGFWRARMKLRVGGTGCCHLGLTGLRLSPGWLKEKWPKMQRCGLSSKFSWLAAIWIGYIFSPSGCTLIPTEQNKSEKTSIQLLLPKTSTEKVKLLLFFLFFFVILSTDITFNYVRPIYHGWGWGFVTTLWLLLLNQGAGRHLKCVQERHHETLILNHKKLSFEVENLC